MSSMVAGLVQPGKEKPKAKAKGAGKAKAKPGKNGDTKSASAGSKSKKVDDEGSSGNTKAVKRAGDKKDPDEKKPLKESALRNTWNEFRNDFIAKNKGGGKTVQELFKEAAEASPS